MREMKDADKQDSSEWWGKVQCSVPCSGLMRTPLFSLYSLHPRRLQLGDTSGLRSCNKRHNWALLFWRLLGFGLLRGFMHLLTPLGNGSINCIQHSAVWDPIPKLTRYTAGRILEFRMDELCFLSSFSPVGMYFSFFLWGLLIATCLLAIKFLWKAGAADENQGSKCTLQG